MWLVTIGLCLGPLGSNAEKPVPPPAADREIENLRAFTKLYGYVRYFHPADAAAETDWDRFAVEGSAAVRGAGGRQALRTALESLFSPIAPTVVIYDPERDDVPGTMPVQEEVADTAIVAWQHSGVGLGRPGPYRSVRTNRADPDVAPGDFAVFSQAVDVTAYQGWRIRLRGAVRADVSGEGSNGRLWLRVDRPDEQQGFFDNMEDRPITSAEWSVHEITGRIDEDGQTVKFGGILLGAGELHADAIELLVKGEDGAWQEVPVKNGSFEAHDDVAVDWHTGGAHYIFDIDQSDSYLGNRSLRIRHEAPSVSGAIFDFIPPVGTSVDKPLGAGLRARIPIALDGVSAKAQQGNADGYSTVGQTVTDEWDVADENVRSAGIAIAWNLMQHFYPYFDVIDTDWDGVLTAALLDTRDDESVDEYVRTLGRMIAELDDGHAFAYPAQQERAARLPFRLRWIEDRAVVAHSAIPDTVVAGDVLLELDGKPVEDVVDEALQFVSGTLRWKRIRVLDSLGSGTEGTRVRMTLDRSGERINVEAVRRTASQVTHELKAIDELDGGVRYVDLTRAPWSDISQALDKLATARGVIFDMRGYPNGNHEILSHLVDEPVRSAIWNVPQIVYPDQERIAGWDRSGRWFMLPHEPRIEGKVVFITDASAISYAESIMGIVEHYELAEIVGEATAGANGNVNWTTLPGGIHVTWTGMRVLKHDGSQHHLIGIEPTIPVQRTIEGVRSREDEFLSAAIRAIDLSEEEFAAAKTDADVLRFLVNFAVAGSGATAAFLNQPTEVESLRPLLREAIGTSRIPQLLMRFGFGPALRPTVRRPAEDVVVPGCR